MPQSYSTAKSMPWRFNPYPPRILPPSKPIRPQPTFTYDRIPSPSPTFRPYATSKQTWSSCIPPDFNNLRCPLEDSDDEKMWPTNHMDYRNSTAGLTRSSLEDETTIGSVATYTNEEKYHSDIEYQSGAKLTQIEVTSGAKLTNEQTCKEAKLIHIDVTSEANLTQEQTCKIDFHEPEIPAGAKVADQEDVYTFTKLDSNENDALLRGNSVEKCQWDLNWRDPDLPTAEEDYVQRTSRNDRLRADLSTAEEDYVQRTSRNDRLRAKMELLLLGLADRCPSMDARALDLLTLSMENFSIAVQHMEREQSLRGASTGRGRQDENLLVG